MHSLKEAFRSTLVSGLRRKAVTTPARWAESYRMMGQPIPGLWTFKYHPWLKGMHEAVERYCVGQKAAQLGYTEALLNVTFYKVDIERQNCMYVLPSKTPDATNFSSARFDTALELSPHLQNLFSNVKNVGHKRAGSSNLYIQGSNSRGGLKGMPVAFMVFDEVDEMNQDNITLGEERISGQFQWQIWKISTPTVPNKGINKEFLLSTQDHFFFKCPSCNRTTELVYPDCLVIEGEHRLDPKISGSHIICKECKAKLDHEDKVNFLKNGVWLPTGPEDAPKRGFYVNQMYSSTVAPAKIAAAVFAAEVDAAAEQELFNSKLGLPSVPKGAQVMDHEITEAIGGRLKNDAAPPNKLIVMGVDQGKWLHYEVDAYTFDKFGSDLNMMATCEVIDEGKVIGFNELGTLMRKWQVRYCVIDAQPERRKAYEFACDFKGFVKTCFYAGGTTGRQIIIDSDIHAHKINVDRTSWLDAALNRFHNGTITLPRDVSHEYRAHLQNQVRRYDVDSRGNPTGYYVSTGDDHLGHARCYAEIALPLAASKTTNQNIRAFL